MTTDTPSHDLRSALERIKDECEGTAPDGNIVGIASKCHRIASRALASDTIGNGGGETVANVEAVREIALQTAADANGGYIDATAKKIVNAALNYVFAHLPVAGDECPHCGWSIGHAAWCITTAGPHLPRLETPPNLTIASFDDRSEDRVCINGCLYLRADTAAKQVAHPPAAEPVGLRAKDAAIRLVRDLVDGLETWRPELLEALRDTPQAKTLRDLINRSDLPPPDHAEVIALRKSLRDLLDACYQADGAEELPDQIDGSLLDAASDALELQYPIIWTDEQVAMLEGRQADASLHPYTCGGDRTDRAHVWHADEACEEAGLLFPTVRGWKCPACDYRQFWSHETGGPSLATPARTDDAAQAGGDEGLKEPVRPYRNVVAETLVKAATRALPSQEVEPAADGEQTCKSCNGFGYARGGICWNCNGVGKEPVDAQGRDRDTRTDGAGRVADGPVLGDGRNAAPLADIVAWLEAIRDVVREAYFAADDSEDRSCEEPPIHCVPHSNFTDLCNALDAAEAFAREGELWNGPGPLVTRIIDILSTQAAYPTGAGEGLAADVVALVVAGREAWEIMASADPGEVAIIDAFDKALERFASRVCYDDEGGDLPEAHATPCTCGAALTPADARKGEG